MTTLILLTALFTADAADTDAGRSGYVAKCQACHGPGGKGDGPASGALPKKPADMTTAAFWKNMSDEKLKATITKGKPGSAMRGFPMKPEPLSDLVAYLNTLKPE